MHLRGVCSVGCITHGQGRARVRHAPRGPAGSAAAEARRRAPPPREAAAALRALPGALSRLLPRQPAPTRAVSRACRRSAGRRRCTAGRRGVTGAWQGRRRGVKARPAGRRSAPGTHAVHGPGEHVLTARTGVIQRLARHLGVLGPARSDWSPLALSVPGSPLHRFCPHRGLATACNSPATALQQPCNSPATALQQPVRTDPPRPPPCASPYSAGPPLPAPASPGRRVAGR